MKFGEVCVIGAWSI